MNFNAFGLKVTLTVALVAGMTAIAQMPAQASSLIAGKTFSFHGTAHLVENADNTATLDFLPNLDVTDTAKNGQASVAYLPSSPPVPLGTINPNQIGTYAQKFLLKDIPLLKTATGWSLAGSSLNWINDASLTQYTLTKFNLAKTLNAAGDLNGFSAAMGGFFTEGSSNFASVKGFFSSQPDLLIEGDSFSASLKVAAAPTGDTPIPTPALLPGLVGLGAAAWRKRQSKLVAA
jgi:hypothetical protein